MQRSQNTEVTAEKLAALSPPHVLEYCREKGRLSVDFRQSCDILHNIVKLMWSIQSIYCVPHSLFLSPPPHFFFATRQNYFTHL